jgi:hypothetical protein
MPAPQARDRDGVEQRARVAGLRPAADRHGERGGDVAALGSGPDGPGHRTVRPRSLLWPG